MADDCGSSGLFVRAAFDTSANAALGNFTAASDAFPLAGNASLGLKRAHVNNEGTNGTTTQSSELTRAGLDIVDGDLPFLLTPDLLQFFGPHITGRPYVGFATWPDIPVPPKMHILLHRDAAVYHYTDQFVNSVRIGSSSGEPVSMTVSFVGQGRDETPATPAAWPTGLETSKSVPYMHHDCTVTVNGATVKVRSWELAHNNALIPIYFGGTRPCGIKRGGLSTTTLRLAVPHTEAMISTLLHGAVPPNSLDVSVALTHPDPNYTSSFRCQALQIPIEDPSTAEGEFLLDLTGTARTKQGGDNDGAPLIIFNDNL